MKTISEYKDLAVQALNGNWGKGVIATLITYLIFSGVSFALMLIFGRSVGDNVGAGDVLSNIATILLMPLAWGLEVFFLSIYRGSNPEVSEIFDGFRNYLKILGTLLLQSIYTILWSLLLIIPGIIKGYSYSMTYFVLKDNPTIGYDAAICESMRLMKGHKMQLFLLDLSMIGWAILSILTLGIGFLFLLPYNNTAHAAFYEDLKNN